MTCQLIELLLSLQKPLIALLIRENTGNELYNNWKGENTGWITKDSLKQFASNVAIRDINQFSQCLESGKYGETVADNFNVAESIGLNVTPSFVFLVNGRQPLEIIGAQPYTVFEIIIVLLK